MLLAVVYGSRHFAYLIAACSSSIESHPNTSVPANPTLMVTFLQKAIPIKIILFLFVGAIGFALDASILSILIFDLGWGHYVSRVVSFGVAVPFSWILNRMLTFRGSATANRTKEYSIYMIIQGAGALLNFAIYGTCIFFSAFMKNYPVVALAIGSVVALVFNYTALQRYAFTGQAETKLD